MSTRIVPKSNLDPNLASIASGFVYIIQMAPRVVKSGFPSLCTIQIIKGLLEAAQKQRGPPRTPPGSLSQKQSLLEPANPTLLKMSGWARS